MVNKICQVCNKLFTVNNYRKDIAKYCSYKCYHIGSRGTRLVNSKVRQICKICNKEFYVYPSRLRNGKKVSFCSNKCAHINLKESMKGKNSVAKIKKICKVCKKKFHILPCRKERLKHCSKKCSGISNGKRFSKNKNYNWKGGITPINEKIRKSIEYRLWREAVFARDNWTCQDCRKRSSKNQCLKIQAHHIKPFAWFPELRFAIDNGITLCKKCHNKIPKRRKNA